MESDLDVLRAVMDKSQTNKNIKLLSKYFSPNFIYDCPFCGQMNFDDYCKQIIFITATAEVKLIDIKDVECCYEVYTELVLIDNKRAKKHNMKFRFDYFMTNGLIIRKIGHCNPTAEQKEFIIGNVYHVPVTKLAEVSK